MANLYTSALVEPVDDLVELTISEISLSGTPSLTISKYSAAEAFIAVITPQIAYVENDDGSNTHIRVYFAGGQVAAGEKIKVEIDN